MATTAQSIQRLDGRWVQGGKSKMIWPEPMSLLLLTGLGKISPGQVTNSLIDFTDFFPTLADLGGAEVPARSCH